MKTFAYLRVSGLSQVDGDGERRQHEACSNFAKQHNLFFDSYFFEKAVSGTVDGMDRPEFFVMLGKCQPGDGIIVERLDRLARDLMVQECILKECRERGVKVFAVDQGSPVDMASNDCDPTRVLIRQVLGALAQWEKSALVLKLRKARDRKRAAGGYCGGERAYGVNPAEAATLDLMRTLNAAGHQPLEVAEILNVGQFRTRAGKYWNNKSVKAILLGRNLRKNRSTPL